MATKSTILIVDDHPLVREGLISILKTAAGYEVVGQAGNAEDAIRLVNDCQPDFTSSDSTQIFTFVLIVPISLNNTTVDAD